MEEVLAQAHAVANLESGEYVPLNNVLMALSVLWHERFEFEQGTTIGILDGLPLLSGEKRDDVIREIGRYFGR